MTPGGERLSNICLAVLTQRQSLPDR